MSDDQSEKKLQSLVNRLQEWFCFLRDIAVAVLVLYILCHPRVVGEFVCRTQLSEFELFGIKGKAECRDFIAQVKLEAVTNEATKQQTVPKDVSQAVAKAEQTGSAFPTHGWIFLGQIASDDNQWMPNKPRTVYENWPVAEKQTVTISDDVYLRNANSITSDILSVVRVNQKAHVVKIEKSPTTGGYFVWAEVDVGR